MRQLCRGRVLGISVAIAHGVFSGSLNILLKFLISRYQFSFLTLVQCLTSSTAALSLELLRRLGLIAVPPFGLSLARSFAGVAVLSTLQSSLTLWSLRGLSLPMYVVFKRCLPLVTMLIGVLVLKNGAPSPGVLAAVLITTCGAALAGDMLPGVDTQPCVFSFSFPRWLCGLGALRSRRPDRRPHWVRNGRAGGIGARSLPGADPEGERGHGAWASHCTVCHRRLCHPSAGHLLFRQHRLHPCLGLSRLEGPGHGFHICGLYPDRLCHELHHTTLYLHQLCCDHQLRGRGEEHRHYYGGHGGIQRCGAHLSVHCWRCGEHPGLHHLLCGQIPGDQKAKQL
ncbi:solute carrier family 35 member D3 isoform X2 [Mastomys coucha]|uniref:solute carrier family 35 member D3 isoform X2 n=1 Tax=Mastomys coucha TaxID=35658 RepID=UPI001261E3E5|nr:solute carrier family 35 member D3 isoform X2 [Mastomys coucha]